MASFRALLQNALAVNSALVAQRQNDEMRRLTESSFAQNEQVKRISVLGGHLFAPTLIGTIYGMNFATCPSSTGSSAIRWRCADGCHGRDPVPDVQTQQVDLMFWLK